MESKQLTRKLNSIFWWTLTALPLILLMFLFLTNFVNFIKEQGSIVSMETIIDSFLTDYALGDMFDYIDGSLMLCVPPFIRTSLINLLNVFGVSSIAISVILYWPITIQVYHVILDLLLFVVRWCHDLMERGAK